jgi:hypothetical protein
VDGVSGNHGGQRLIPHAYAHLREKTVNSHFLDKASEAIAGAEPGEGFVIIGLADVTLTDWLLTGCQAVNLRLSDAMVAPLCTSRTHVACVNPSLERRIRDAEALSGYSNCEKGHPDTRCEVDLNRITTS